MTWVTAGELAEVMKWSERYVYKLAHLHRWRRVKEGRLEGGRGGGHVAGFHGHSLVRMKMQTAMFTVSAAIAHGRASISASDMALAKRKQKMYSAALFTC